jgi:hypothetical protein
MAAGGNDEGGRLLALSEEDLQRLREESSLSLGTEIA